MLTFTRSQVKVYEFLEDLPKAQHITIKVTYRVRPGALSVAKRRPLLEISGGGSIERPHCESCGQSQHETVGAAFFWRHGEFEYAKVDRRMHDTISGAMRHIAERLKLDDGRGK